MNRKTQVVLVVVVTLAHLKLLIDELTGCAGMMAHGALSGLRFEEV